MLLLGQPIDEYLFSSDSFKSRLPFGEAWRLATYWLSGPVPGRFSRTTLRSCWSQHMIVEADPEVGVPVHCGECLSQMAVDNLDLELPKT